MKKGFTLIELLAVIVILAIIALIATPIVLGIIDDTKESAQIRSAEMYLKGVANAVMKENLEQEGNFKPIECIITSEGNLDCDDKEGILEVEVDGEKPKNGKITFEEGKIKEIELVYNSITIVKDENNKLVDKLKLPEVLITSLNVTYENCGGILECIPTIEIEPSNATNKNLEFSINNYSYTSCGSTYSFKDNITLDSSTGIITKKENYSTTGSDAKIKVTVKTLDGSNITKEVSFVMYKAYWSCFF